MNISNEQELHRIFMEEAIKMAEVNLEGNNGGPFGAVIVKDGSIISKGSNLVTNSNDPTAHAEIVAIREACKVLNDFQLTGCDVYCSCEPCPMCLGAIYWARPKRVFYASNRHEAAIAGFDDEFIYEELKLGINERTIVTIHLPLPNASEVFRKWTLLDKKIPY